MSEDNDALRAEIFRLNKIVRVLIDRAERSTNLQSSDFSLFQATIMLEEQVRERTRALEQALRDNEQVTRDLMQQREEQRVLIKKLQEAHTQLLQSETLASVGQLAAGVAHEINNPIGFVNANLGSLKRYTQALFILLDQYAALEGQLPPAAQQQIATTKESVELDYLRADIDDLLKESAQGAERIRRIVHDLQDFARFGETDWQTVDIHGCIESTLNVARSELAPKAEVVRDYGELPGVECQPFQLNQVFLNILRNAVQAIPERGTITIQTRSLEDQVSIAISDTGTGMPANVRDRIFDPFFTTKPVGSGTGLGLSVAYGIVKRHGGRIEVHSEAGAGATFTVTLPIKQI